jgi:hypothetical protein
MGLEINKKIKTNTDGFCSSFGSGMSKSIKLIQPILQQATSLIYCDSK